MLRVSSSIRVATVAVAVAAAVLAVGLRAQVPAKADADFLRKAYDTYKTMQKSSPQANVAWQYLGPKNISGRATDIAVADRPSGRRIYAAYATSGVWKTDDNGATWQVVFEDIPSTSIGDVATAPSNPDILWVGTGEANLFRASMAGVGIYKSSDAGRTFTHMGLTDSHTIGRIVVHPTNPDIVYVAASGHEWTDNDMRGVFKTADGGKTWDKVFYRSPRTGAWDLVMDPSNPEVLYVSMWQRVRRKWSDPRAEPGYDEGGIWKTTDGGKTWNEANTGLTAPQFRGRIGIDISRSNPKVLYAFVDSYEPGRAAREGETDAYGRPIFEARIKAAEIYKTEDGGATWRKTSDSNDFMTGHSGTYGWVFAQIRVHPTDENTIYTLGLALNISHDSGKTFARYPTSRVHGDHHGLWIDPKNPDIVYNVNDGGFFQTEDSGKSWKFAVSAGGAQFYNVVVDNSTPAWVYGSVQDIGSRRGKLDLSAGRDTIAPVDFEEAPGGEGSNQAVDPTNPNVVYSHGFYGNFTRDDLSVPVQPGRRGGAGGDQPAGPRRSTSIRPKEEGLRAQWMAPVVISPHDSNTVYLGYQYVFRSTNRGETWEKISGDLTGSDPQQMLPKSSSEIPYQTITQIAESPRVKGLIYAGTDDGRLHMTADAGKTWTDLSARVPTKKWYSRIVPSQHADQTVYVTQRGREDDDFAAYVYKSTDGGRTFTSIAANLPAGPVNVIRESPRDANVLLLGTDFGAFISTDAGRHWNVLGGNLPSTQVSDLAYQGRDNMIVISTFGRGIWVLDAMKLRIPNP